MKQYLKSFAFLESFHEASSNGFEFFSIVNIQRNSSVNQFSNQYFYFPVLGIVLLVTLTY